MKNIYFSILLIICMACNTSNNTSIKILSIKNNSDNSNIALSKIVSSTKMIPLETNDSILIGEINKILCKNNYIYVSDGRTLFKFDNNGHFVSKINKVGAGPNEYTSITDFQICSNDKVWILSRKDKRLCNYSWNGILENRIRLNFWINNICLLTDNSMLLFTGNETEGGNKYQLKKIDLSTKNIVDNYIKIDNERSKYLFVKSTNHFNYENNSKNGFFFDIFNDTIYGIYSNKIRAKYYIDINKKNIPNSFFKKNYDNVMIFFQTLFKNEYAYGTVLFGETNKNFICSYYYNKLCHISLISKYKYKVNDFTNITDDVNLMNYPITLTSIPLFIQDNDELIISIQATDIMDYAEKNLKDKDISKLKQSIRYTNEDQNPIIIFSKLK
ncbi:MAG: 6-bladed beta-propeller [Tissierellia bacterium]|nr:6-bladed beta-propeller [Tissierellia bacterium]